MNSPVPNARLMGWTVMPARVTARAWADDEFRRQLLDSPRETLSLVLSSDVPPNIVIVEDDLATRTFPLPKSAGRLRDDPDQLRRTLEEEIGSGPPFEWALPAESIARSLTDPEYRSALINNPSDTLRAEGYEPPEGIRVVANGGTQHVVLPPSPYGEARIIAEQVAEELYESFGDRNLLNTTKCCAGGTTT